MASFTTILNLTIDENDSKSSPRSESSNSDISQISVHSATEENSIIVGDEIVDSKEQKGDNKRKEQLGTSTCPRAKRQRLQMPPTIFSKVFPKTESFQRPEFLSWLKSNQHLLAIKGGTSKVCELLDKVPIENPGLDEIFFAFAENGERVNPSFFDIAQLVRPSDSVIHPPRWSKWNKPTASAATYVWSFDFPVKDIEGYCKEIEQDIRTAPHDDPDTADHRPSIVAQFRNYIENELPLRKKVEVFRWLYVGQTEQRPPTKRWTGYYRKKKLSQRTLRFTMNTLVEREVPHRFVVVFTDGSKDTEALVAALLNVRVDKDGEKSNAINRAVCG